MTDVRIPETIGIGGFGRVLKGEHNGQYVALKVMYQVEVRVFHIFLVLVKANPFGSIHKERTFVGKL